MSEAYIVRRGGGSKTTPLPMTLVPVYDSSKWTFTDLGNREAYLTDEGHINLDSSNTATAKARYNEILKLSKAGELVFTYSQTWSQVPRVRLINIATGAIEFTVTAAVGNGSLSSTFEASIDISAANGEYYLEIDTVDYYGDKASIIRSLTITKRS